MPQPPEGDLFVLPDEYASCCRHKRSLLKSHRNEELNVETLVVVDRKMTQTHGHENITTYVLTILNMSRVQNSREQTGPLCKRAARFEGAKVFIYQKSVRGPRDSSAQDRPSPAGLWGLGERHMWGLTGNACLFQVSALFKDGTIGGNINIAVVGLILLEEDQPGLVISHHADHTLSSFCQWQSGLMGKDGTRHDHAILLTGLDICSWKNEPCDTLGFAPISGMCSKYRSCTINEDTGLGLAFTIAHESGHK
ncbi:A disintegrin and metalloproteinase with thrombospondin motifs 16 [Panthera uncia]|uniref:A disintegrin and metalloproteinase with thrombospondin motifs 16 n=1 Tax=Panthera uncia TaxID=29064 RepID=UPI0020FFC4AA|nr:A disintegrin and metalloproteinase with thrombospondin motifs 16 [Panthera uncia]